MFKILKCLISSFTLLLLVISLSSCGGSDSPVATGTLNIKLTDDSSDKYQALYVTINEVHVHHETLGWEILNSSELALPQTLNLLELINGKMADLGIAELPAGHYNQMRLILGTEPIEPPEHEFANYLVIKEEGLETVKNEELKVPSGFQTGIKLVNGFDIVASGATTGVVLDFDAHRSIVQKGNGDFGLKPTIKVLETVDNTVSGTVENEDGSAFENAYVSAQIYYPPTDGLDPKEKVFIEDGTQSDADGNFLMYLPPDIYNIVVTSPGYLPVCQEVEAQFFEAYTADEVFVLHPVSVDPVESGTLRVSVSGLSETTEALISIRQEADCGSGNIKIEVEVLPVANDTDNDFLLPIGPYQIVTSADGKETQVDNVDVAVTGTELNIQF